MAEDARTGDNSVGNWKAGCIEGLRKLAIADREKNYDEGPDLSSVVANNASMVNHMR